MFHVTCYYMFIKSMSQKYLGGAFSPKLGPDNQNVWSNVCTLKNKMQRMLDLEVARLKINFSR